MRAVAVVAVVVVVVVVGVGFGLGAGGGMVWVLGTGILGINCSIAGGGLQIA